MISPEPKRIFWTNIFLAYRNFLNKISLKRVTHTIIKPIVHWIATVSTILIAYGFLTTYLGIGTFIILNCNFAICIAIICSLQYLQPQKQRLYLSM